jgi:hypothetical protein
MADTKNTERELRKKEREVALCAIVARTINAMENTDYIVRGAEHQIALCKEPVDVVLESKTGAHPSRQVQVVTIPSNEHLEMRDDNNNISKFENRLKSILIDRKTAGLEVHIDITAEAELHGVPARAVNRIADLIQLIQHEGSWGMHDPEIWEYSEDVQSTYRMFMGFRFLRRHCLSPRDEDALFFWIVA